MPTYEYECKSCGSHFEVFQSMSDEPLTTCAQCGSEVRRLIFGGAGVIFKGSGFYVTDKGKANGKVSPAAAPASKAATDTVSKAAPADKAPKTETKTTDASPAPAKDGAA
jgi:putative FmdB family regulatory protein